ncbi:carboxylesterase [Tricladium varicosporioides]|nr:carboxylesterase [Hymenoscyphus varicosporioides]
MGFSQAIQRAICLASALSSRFQVRAGCSCTIDEETFPTALTNQGQVSGFQDASGNSVFLGIPYAATTGGDNRWLAPQDPPSHLEIFNASSFGPTCPQAISGTSYTEQGEDCLSVNIWAPADGYNLPVFVYIYGGAMVTGSSSNPQFQGNNFARKDVIMVSFNMRESIFASPNSAELNGTSQNFSILDVDKAMEWIHDNIAAFGGNPDHIVLGGHSSGGVQVDDYLWNHPDTWLVGAIEMSANAQSGPAYAPMNVALDVVAAEVNCSTGVGQLDCLRKVDLYDFQTTYFNSTTNTWFTPAIDEITRYRDYSARLAAGNYPSHVPLITGNSNGEGTIFSIVYSGENTNFPAWINTFDADSAHIPDDVLLATYNTSDFSTVSLESGTQYGDIRFDCATDYFVDLRANLQDTWVYRFFGAYDNVVGVPGTAPTHGTEIPFFLGGNECFSSLTNVTVAEQALADSINGWFVEWIKNPSAGPGWNRVTPKSGTVALLGTPGNETEVILGSTGDYNARCQAMYNKYYPLYPVVQNPVALTAATASS